LAGSYRLSGSNLTLGQRASTLMACAEGMDTEKAFLKALARVRTWKIEGQQLELLDGDGHLLAYFEVRSQSSPSFVKACAGLLRPRHVNDFTGLPWLTGLRFCTFHLF
jgi:hypothetical protein